MKEKIRKLIQAFDIKKFIRFGCIGVLNTAIDFGIFWLLAEKLGVNTYVSHTVSFIAAATNSFLWNKYWTFEKKKKPTKEEVTRFIIMQAGYYVISLGLMRLFVGTFGLENMIGKLLTGGIMIVFNYLISKFWVFNGRK